MTTTTKTEEESILTPADLDAAGETHTYPHRDPEHPFPHLDNGLNKLIIDATRHFYYYMRENKSKGDYYMQEGKHAFSALDETNVKRILLDIPGITREKPKDRNGATMENTMIDYCLAYIARYKGLQAIRPLISGHRAGIDEKTRTLYLRELQLTTPHPGEWKTIRAIIESILTEPGKIRTAEESAAVTRAQIAYFYAWAAHAVRTLYAWQYAPGALLALIGAPDAGKSFFVDKIIAPMLATPKPASCAAYLAEGKFNAEWAPCALLTADDKGVIIKSAIRRQASELLKSLLSPGPKSITGKGVDTYNEYTFWRFVICANTTNIDGLILEVNGSTEDKIAALYCGKINVPNNPNQTTEERAALDAAIAAEMPAFIHYLLHDYTCPNPAPRYGAPVYRHPKLDEALRNGSKNMAVLDYIAGIIQDDSSDTATFHPDRLKDKTAKDIRAEIGKSATATGRDKERPPMGWGNNPRTLKATLHALAEEYPQYITTRYNTTKKTDVFTIHLDTLLENY